MEEFSTPSNLPIQSSPQEKIIPLGPGILKDSEGREFQIEKLKGGKTTPVTSLSLTQQIAHHLNQIGVERLTDLEITIPLENSPFSEPHEISALSPEVQEIFQDFTGEIQQVIHHVGEQVSGQKNISEVQLHPSGITTFKKSSLLLVLGTKFAFIRKWVAKRLIQHLKNWQFLSPRMEKQLFSELSQNPQALLAFSELMQDRSPCFQELQSYLAALKNAQDSFKGFSFDKKFEEVPAYQHLQKAEKELFSKLSQYSSFAPIKEIVSDLTDAWKGHLDQQELIHQIENSVQHPLDKETKKALNTLMSDVSTKFYDLFKGLVTKRGLHQNPPYGALLKQIVRSQGQPDLEKKVLPLIDFFDFHRTWLNRDFEKWFPHDVLPSITESPREQIENLFNSKVNTPEKAQKFESLFRKLQTAPSYQNFEAAYTAAFKDGSPENQKVLLQSYDQLIYYITQEAISYSDYKETLHAFFFFLTSNVHPALAEPSKMSLLKLFLPEGASKFDQTIVLRASRFLVEPHGRLFFDKMMSSFREGGPSLEEFGKCLQTLSHKLQKEEYQEFFNKPEIGELDPKEIKGALEKIQNNQEHPSLTPEQWKAVEVSQRFLGYIQQLIAIEQTDERRTIPNLWGPTFFRDLNTLGTWGRVHQEFPKLHTQQMKDLLGEEIHRSLLSHFQEPGHFVAFRLAVETHPEESLQTLVPEYLEHLQETKIFNEDIGITDSKKLSDLVNKLKGSYPVELSQEDQKIITLCRGLRQQVSDAIKQTERSSANLWDVNFFKNMKAIGEWGYLQNRLNDEKGLFFSEDWKLLTESDVEVGSLFTQIKGFQGTWEELPKNLQRKLEAVTQILNDTRYYAKSILESLQALREVDPQGKILTNLNRGLRGQISRNLRGIEEIYTQLVSLKKDSSHFKAYVEEAQKLHDELKRTPLFKTEIPVMDGVPQPSLKQLKAVFGAVREKFPFLFSMRNIGENPQMVARIVQYTMLGEKATSLPFPEDGCCFQYAEMRDLKDVLRIMPEGNEDVRNLYLHKWGSVSVEGYVNSFFKDCVQRSSYRFQIGEEKEAYNLCDPGKTEEFFEKLRQSFYDSLVEDPSLIEKYAKEFEAEPLTRKRFKDMLTQAVHGKEFQGRTTEEEVEIILKATTFTEDQIGWLLEKTHRSRDEIECLLYFKAQEMMILSHQGTPLIEANIMDPQKENLSLHFLEEFQWNPSGAKNQINKIYPNLNHFECSCERFFVMEDGETSTRVIKFHRDLKVAGWRGENSSAVFTNFENFQFSIDAEEVLENFDRVMVQK